MTPSRSITVLHISDLQFGRHHRFGNLAAGDPDAQFDSLLTRLQDNLFTLQEQEPGWEPDVIVVSGDLAEWGMRSEFSDAFEFLEQLTTGLGLSRDRVAVVPGNHDLNRKLCEAHFSECEADERPPSPPYARKWEPYLRRFEEFYEDAPEITFTVEEPWSLWEIEDLNLVIAGLNSTMRESHRDEDHYGWVGDGQLRWFAERLEVYAEKEWFRLGVVHHNPARGPVADDENLRDADRLAALLAPSLNLLLHGHTHDGKISWLGDAPLPVLSTGSAALAEGARPPEVPNQYQLLRLREGGIERWARIYDPDGKRWIADTSVSADGSTGTVRHETSFDRCAAAFGPDVDDFPTKSPAESAYGFQVGRSDTFASRVMEICELRHGGDGTQMEAMLNDPRCSYLRVRTREGGVIQSFPIGLVEGDVTPEVVDGFCGKVFDRYRALDPHLRCKIVYGGDRPDEEVLKRANERNVELNSFVEFQGIIDFRGYLDRQAARLRADTVYPPALYVPQQLVYEVGTERHTAEDAVTQLMGWVAEPRARFVLVLGDFGTGKTFMLRELARRMPSEVPHLVPMLIELRSLEKARTIHQLVAQHLATAGERFIDLEAFPYMLRQGRIALLVDGFDELAMRVTYKRATEHFDTLLQAAGGDAKVILTSRTQHFESDQQVRSALLERAEMLPGLSLCRVQPFDDEQILAFLERRFGDRSMAEERFDLLDEIKDLLGLSHNPRMLDFIAQIPEKQLREARLRSGEITAARLYRLLIDQWLDYEWDKAEVRGVAPSLSAEQRWEAVTELALRLWAKIDRAVHVSELTERVSAAAESLSAGLEGASSLDDPETMAHLVGSRTLLVRDDEGAFEFVHASVMEWFVANHAAGRLAAGGSPETLGHRDMTDLMTAFFCDLAGSAEARAWAREAVDSDESPAARSNALRVLTHLGEEAPGAELAGEHLSGRDLFRRKLSGAKLKGVDLTEARMGETDLRDADLTGATLTRADLTRASLAGAILKGADLRAARLLGANLRDADLEGADLRRAKLIGALGIDRGALAGAETFGAALPSSDMPEAQFEAVESRITATAFHPFDEILASGHENGTVCLWDSHAGVQLRSFRAQAGWLDDLVFSPDGKLMATVGGASTVQIWDFAHGVQQRTIPGLQDGLRRIAFSPDGTLLAGAGRDGTLRIWKVASGIQLHALPAHTGWARDIAFSPDGRVLASGGSDEEVKLWDPRDGSSLGTLPGHGSGTWSVAFSPDGRLLVTSGSDNYVRLWDWQAGKEIATLSGHRQRVRQAIFSPNGRYLASAGDDSAVRLWNAETGSLLHEISGHAGYQPTIAFSPDGDLLVDATVGLGLRISDPATGEPVRVLRSPRPVRSSALALCPDGDFLASIDEDEDLRLWDPRTAACIKVLAKPRSSVRSVAVSPDSRLVATGDDEGVVRLWNPQSGSEEESLYGLTGPVYDLAFLSKSELVACVGGHVRLWDLHKGTETARAFGFGGDMRRLAVSPDKRFLVAIDDELSLYIFNRTSDLSPVMLSGSRVAIEQAAFSSDGAFVAGASSNGSVYVWDLRTAVSVQRFEGHEGSVSSVAFSPGGSTLVSGGSDGIVRFWDVKTGLLKELGHGRSAIRSLAFVPAGDLLATVEEDGAIRLWDLTTDTLKATMAGVAEGWVSYASDGRYKLAGRIGGSFWFSIGLCRFAPGELDEFLAPTGPRRVALDTPL